MQWHVAPVADDAGSGFVPIASAVSRQIVPVEGLVIELARGPLRHTVENVFLGDEFAGPTPVSYTHLDVYKRQVQIDTPISCRLATRAS